LYESRIVKKTVISEAMPPYGAGEAAGDPDKPEWLGKVPLEVSPDKMPATMHSQYAEKQPRLDQNAATALCRKVAIEVLKHFKKFPDGIDPREVDEFRKEVITPILLSIRLPNGKPIMAPSWLKNHTSREIDNVLRKAKIIAYTPAGGVKVGRPKRDLGSITDMVNDALSGMDINITKPTKEEGGVPKLNDEDSEDTYTVSTKERKEPPMMRQNEIRFQAKAN
jgi:hypothetical protein